MVDSFTVRFRSEPGPEVLKNFQGFLNPQSCICGVPYNATTIELQRGESFYFYMQQTCTCKTYSKITSQKSKGLDTIKLRMKLT